MPLMLFDVIATHENRPDPRQGYKGDKWQTTIRDVEAGSAAQAVMVVRWRHPLALGNTKLKAVRPRFAVVPMGVSRG